MLYTFTSCESVHELYVLLLKASITTAVAISLLVSLDRMLHVVKYLHATLR